MQKKYKIRVGQLCSALLVTAIAQAAMAQNDPQFRPMDAPPWAGQQQQPEPQFAPPDYRRAPPPRRNAPPAPPQGGAYGPPPGYQQGPYGPPPGYRQAAPQPMPQQGPYSAPPGYGAYPPPPPPRNRNRGRSWSDGPSGWFGRDNGGSWFKGRRKPWRGDSPWDFMEMDDPKGSMSDGWDDMLNAPSRMGEMPGGWYAPSVDVPNPIDVGEEFGDAAKDVPGQVDDMRKDNINDNLDRNLKRN
ncbi:hypothetical protein BOW16_04720 [Solemya velum gill symbiont]|uniref:Uncharacterized protein n=1 Tax=Solemya velum gill symbiont TaxID=2340 RepID=A0A0B0HF42_SOVGS|nr:hypothetical protein [Solemya velum gill symbiont]KHF26539.1 hypothetical protein JV46_11870 [Solemya velum gill symbiont]OOY52655.1 hypothetical protein BOV97_04855 [Solemya velum gill symbiont]OOY65823.1 hypothetical protein BOW05_03955 [Solemya velum gill symbiont]OOY67780.1 hypothetical protein BOW06_04835 [Solemya velum gill symbiont]OOY70317.1 hypothetical protein BOW07_04980 [Solemya velum gill symbiont]